MIHDQDIKTSLWHDKGFRWKAKALEQKLLVAIILRNYAKRRKINTIIIFELTTQSLTKFPLSKAYNSRSCLIFMKL